ncbi:MAG: hypothetical protein IIC88_00830 [Chloroflexi bacterium]|nr:hypothetical protein [Chloroflexota bacterium]
MPRIQNVANNDSDPTLLDDMVEAITGAAVKAALEADRPKTAKQARANYDAEIRQLTRDGSKPPAAPKGSAGGGAKYTREQFSTMTPQQAAAVPKEERDRILAAG